MKASQQLSANNDRERRKANASLVAPETKSSVKTTTSASRRISL